MIGVWDNSSHAAPYTSTAIMNAFIAVQFMINNVAFPYWGVYVEFVFMDTDQPANFTGMLPFYIVDDTPIECNCGSLHCLQTAPDFGCNIQTEIGAGLPDVPETTPYSALVIAGLIDQVAATGGNITSDEVMSFFISHQVMETISDGQLSQMTWQAYPYPSNSWYFISSAVCDPFDLMWGFPDETNTYLFAACTTPSFWQVCTDDTCSGSLPPYSFGIDAPRPLYPFYGTFQTLLDFELNTGIFNWCSMTSYPANPMSPVLSCSPLNTCSAAASSPTEFTKAFQELAKTRMRKHLIRDRIMPDEIEY